MTYFVSVTSQGQMSIPAPVRKQLGITAGEKVIVNVEDKKMTVEPVPDHKQLLGIFKATKKIPFSVTRKAFEEALARGAA